MHKSITKFIILALFAFSPISNAEEGFLEHFPEKTIQKLKQEEKEYFVCKMTINKVTNTPNEFGSMINPQDVNLIRGTPMLSLFDSYHGLNKPQILRSSFKVSQTPQFPIPNKSITESINEKQIRQQRLEEMRNERPSIVEAKVLDGNHAHVYQKIKNNENILDHGDIIPIGHNLNANHFIIISCENSTPEVEQMICNNDNNRLFFSVKSWWFLRKNYTYDFLKEDREEEQIFFLKQFKNPLLSFNSQNCTIYVESIRIISAMIMSLFLSILV